MLFIAVFSGFLVLSAPAPSRAGPDLRVCADPNNLPFSNDRLEGFENRIVSLLAQDLGRRVRYTWWAQRRGFLRNTLKAGVCDLVPGVPTSMEMLATTRPYYRSTYVFVSRADDNLGLTSFDDPRLRTLRIGVQMIGDDAANAPPAHALARRGIVQNVVGYTVYGDYRQANPPARIIDAVANGDVDVALAWGPLAGYFAQKELVPLVLTPVAPSIDGPTLPMLFDISMGVRRDDVELKRQIGEALERNRPAIDAILAAYGVPRAEPPVVRRQAGGDPH